MNPPLFSIIMPVYNAAETLCDAVGSITTQTCPDWELLLVDDGSTDASAALAERLAAADPRIRLLRQQNAGICAARNRGLDEAKGTYIGFCDDDDLYEPAALAAAAELLGREMQTEAGGLPDLVRTGYTLARQADDGRLVPLPHPAGETCALRPGAGGAAYLAFLQNSGPQFVWNAWYRRDFLRGIRFDGRCTHGLEDFVFNAAVFAAKPRAVYTPTVTCRHFERASSTSRAEMAGVAARLAALPAWAQAEHAAAAAQTEGRGLAVVWALRKAELITFVMHQLRDSAAGPDFCAAAWGRLRAALRPFANRAAGLDFLRAARHNKKKAAALLLYALHLPGAYAHLPNKEEKLLA